MLKSLNQPQLSPAPPSPRIYQQPRYVSSSPRITTDTGRRKSYISEPSPTSAPAPPRKNVHYVSRGTQYSPIAQKMENVHPVPTSSTTQLSQRTELPQPTNVAPTSKPLPPTKPALNLESPSVKRRNSAETERSAYFSALESAPKRTRSAPPAIKVLPLKYEECAIEDLVILIASMISELIETNDALPPRPNPVLTRFHSRTPPAISVLDYLQRLAKHATLTPPLLLSMVYYIDRLCALYPDFTVTTLTIHRFLIVSATVAAKGLSDSFWNNTTYAKVGGIKLTELGMLELEFLYRVDWRIVPNPEVLVDYYKGLVDRTEGYKLEGDGSSSESEEDDEEDSDMVDSPPDGEPGTETAARWQAWMDENKNAKPLVKSEEESSLGTVEGPSTIDKVAGDSKQKLEDDRSSVKQEVKADDSSVP